MQQIWNVLSLSFIVLIISGCTSTANKLKPVAGRDYEVNVLIDTVLIYEPETGKEVVKINERRDTTWLNGK